MILKSIVPKRTLETSTFAYVALAAVSLATAFLYGSNQFFTNPFFVLACYFVVGFVVKLFTFAAALNGSLTKAGVDSVSNLILSPLKVLTAVLIAALWYSEGNVIFNTLIAGAFLWFSFSGVLGATPAVASLFQKIQDRYFNRELKKVAAAARIERAVVADLTDFFDRIYPKEKDK